MNDTDKNIDQLLKSAFSKQKQSVTAVPEADSPDFLLISKYIDGTASDQERQQIDQLQVSSWRIRRLVQSTEYPFPVSRTVIPLLLHQPAVAFRIAACFLILLGAGFLTMKLIPEKHYYVTESHIQCTSLQMDTAGFPHRVTRDIYMSATFADPAETQLIERRLQVKSENGDEAYAEIVVTM